MTSLQNIERLLAELEEELAFTEEQPGSERWTRRSKLPLLRQAAEQSAGNTRASSSRPDGASAVRGRPLSRLVGAPVPASPPTIGRQESEERIAWEEVPRRRHLPTLPKLPRYNGETALDGYLVQVEMAAELGGWSPEETALQVALNSEDTDTLIRYLNFLKRQLDELELTLQNPRALAYATATKIRVINLLETSNFTLRIIPRNAGESDSRLNLPELSRRTYEFSRDLYIIQEMEHGNQQDVPQPEFERREERNYWPMFGYFTAALDIPIPYFFIGERSKEIEERKTMLLDVLKTAECSTDLDTSMDRVMTEEEAIKIIQMVERAWQGRVRAKLNKEIRFSDFDRRHRVKTAGSAFNELAAIRIQKVVSHQHYVFLCMAFICWTLFILLELYLQVWKGYLQRKRTKIARDEEMIFLGMVMDPKYQVPLSAEIDAQSIDASIRVKQKKHEEVYLNALDEILKQIREMEWNDMSKTMKNQIRQWFYECRNATGLFPDYPTVEEGGSAIIFAEKTPQQLVEEIALKEEEAATSKSKGKPKGKDEKKDKGKKDKGKGKGAEEDEEGLKMMPSAFLSELEVANKRYKEVWKNRNESENFSQIHKVELIKEEMRKVVEAEVRLQVDEEMREELAELKLAVDKEKPGKQKGPKKKKGSKGGKKKKKEKDLTPDRTLTSLCEELVQQGLLKRAKNFRMQDFLGDYNYLGTTLRQNDIEPMPSLLDVRQVLSLYGILPLGASEVHEKAPLIKSILLVGPAGVGKSMLVHAICQETGATLFDLSPYTIAGKYPGKPGLAMMLHMVFKVARLLQPSVIWIGDAEKMFYKKVPKEEEQLEPRRLKKDFPKCLKLIKPEDRVLIIGTTKSPQNSDIKGMCKLYGKIILIPRPDYGSRYILWEKLIKKQGGKITNALDLTSLTKVTDGYTPGHMVQVISSVVTKDRINDLTKQPLTADDFIVPLAKFEPVLQKDEEAIKNWYAKTPLGKRRIKAAAEKEEALLKAKDAKNKKKK